MRAYADTRRQQIAYAAVTLLAVAVAACGGATQAPPLGADDHIARPVATTPSKSAKMTCAPEASKDISQVLGATTAQPLRPTWVDSVYSCRYSYPNGMMVLSVKELTDSKQTDQYFSELRHKLGHKEQLNGLGQGAFTTRNDGAVVRKDYKVLLVDTSHLPPQFGSPPQSRIEVATNVAATIMGCWTGA